MKNFFLPLISLSAAFMMACSDDSGTSVSESDQLGVTDPSNPGVVDPSNPGVVDPSNPGVVDPSNPGVVDPSNPVVDTYYSVLPPANEAAVRAMYDSWIQKFYVTYEEEVHQEQYIGIAMVPKLQGSARIKFDSPANTVSEGMGYGLLITCMMGDWEKFDRLFKYYMAYPVSAASEMYFMKWKVTGDALDDPMGNGGFVAGATGGSATDADLDVVTALLVAYMKNPAEAKRPVEEYKDYALKVAHSILATEVNATTHLLMPGNDGKHMNDGYVYNISYFSLVALKLLAQYDVANAAAWNQVLDASIEYMTKVQAAGNGLWPDWSNAEGIPTDPENGSSTGKNNNFFGLEGVRIPLRIMWYYNWFNDPKAQVLASTAAQYTFTQTGGDITKTLIRYIYQGDQPTVGAGGAHFRGSVCSLWTVDNNYAAFTDACNQVILSTAFNATKTLYFEPSMQMLYALYLNGYFKKS